MVTCHAWNAIAAVPQQAAQGGPRMMPTNLIFHGPLDEDAVQQAKMLEIMTSSVGGFQ
jgi:hypothetical protein